MKGIIGRLFILFAITACTKPETNVEEKKEGNPYTIEVHNLNSTGKLILQSSVEPLKTIDLKVGATKVVLYAKTGEYVKLSVLLPSGGNIYIRDKKNIQLPQTPLSGNLQNYMDTYFLAFDADDPVKDPFQFKAGVAKLLSEHAMNKTFVLNKHYYVENGIESDIPISWGCRLDDGYIIKPSSEVYLNLNPDLFVASVEITAGSDNCGGWPESAYQSSYKISVFSGNSTPVLFPIFDPSSIEYPNGFGHVNLQFDSVSAVNKTLTFHRMVGTKKEVFIFKTIN